MKYLGKIADNKDLVTKEYVDTSVEIKQDKLIAGANITIADDGKTISATGGGTSESDIFILEIEADDNNNVTYASHTFEETKAAIQSNKVIMLIWDDKFIATYYYIASNGSRIEIIVSHANLLMSLSWENSSEGLGTIEIEIGQNIIIDPFNPPMGYLFCSENGVEAKQIPTYTAGDGISISRDNVISVTAPRVYSGANAPADTLGDNGDIYIQIPEA